MLGPMVNPSSPNNQLIGVFNLELGRIYNYIYQNLGKNYAIVHSLDGYDEVSLTGDFRLQSNFSDSLQSPSDLGLTRNQPEEILGGKTVKESADIFLNILQGNGSEAQNNVVLANAGLAINCVYPNRDYSSCLEKAKDSLYGKHALKSFNNLLN
jgi:anthranilate phosphoribosyltransferase